MKGTRLKNIASKTYNQDDFQEPKTHRNLVVKMNRRAKRRFHASLDPNVIGKDKHFWRTFKSFLSEQSCPKRKATSS